LKNLTNLFENEILNLLIIGDLFIDKIEFYIFDEADLIKTVETINQIRNE
jgi:hypothetical protein